MIAKIVSSDDVIVQRIDNGLKITCSMNETMRELMKSGLMNRKFEFVKSTTYVNCYSMVGELSYFIWAAEWLEFEPEHISQPQDLNIVSLI